MVRMCRFCVWCWLVGLVLSNLTVYSQGIASAYAELTPSLVGGTAMSGLGAYVPGQWGVVSTSIENPADQAVDLLVVHQFDADPHVQFGARVWVPAQSIRRVWSLVRPPNAYDTDVRQLGTQTLLLDDHEATEFQIDREQGLLLGTNDSLMVAVLQDYDESPLSPTVQAMLISGGHSKRSRYMSAKSAPSTAAGWQALDLLVASATAIRFDESQWIALRHWLLAGGRLWVFYPHDKEQSAQAMRRLLGDSWSMAVVDELPLTRFDVEGSRKTLSVDSEVPISMTRVLWSGFEVHHTVRGWPVTLTKTVGRGCVIVSTIDPRAWIKPGPGGENIEVATRPLRDIESLLMDDRASVNDERLVEAISPYVPTMIGYRVIERGMVSMILAVFLGVLIIGGIGLYRKRKLEWMALVGPVAAVAVAGVLLLLGTLRGREVPTTVASAQLIRVVPEQHQAIVSGVMSLFSPTSEVGKVEVNSGGVIWWPDTSAQSNKTLRAIWTDVDQWYWDNLTLPPRAVLNATFENVLNIDDPITVVGQFGPDGLTIDFSSGMLRDLKDPLVATSTGVMLPRLDKQGRYVIGPNDIVQNEQYVRSLSLSREQMQHQAVYGDLLATSQLASPTWWVWARPVDLGFELIDGATHRDWALAAVPIRFQTPEVGSLRVLSPFLPYTVVRNPDGSSSAAIYDTKNREWISPLTPGYTIWLRFQLPLSVAEANPTVETLALTLDIDAPDRDVELLDPVSNGRTVHDRINRPRGETTLSMDDGQIYQIDESGGITIGMRITDSPADVLSSQWSLHEVRLELLLNVPVFLDSRKSDSMLLSDLAANTETALLHP